MNRFKNTAKTFLSCADTRSNSTLDEFWSEIEIGFPIFSSNSSSVELEPISAQVSNFLAVFKSIHSLPRRGCVNKPSKKTLQAQVIRSTKWRRGAGLKIK